MHSPYFVFENDSHDTINRLERMKNNAKTKQLNNLLSRYNQTENIPTNSSPGFELLFNYLSFFLSTSDSCCLTKRNIEEILKTSAGKEWNAKDVLIALESNDIL